MSNLGRYLAVPLPPLQMVVRGASSWISSSRPPERGEGDPFFSCLLCSRAALTNLLLGSRTGSAGAIYDVDGSRSGGPVGLAFLLLFETTSLNFPKHQKRPPPGGSFFWTHRVVCVTINGKNWNIPPCGACATCRDARGRNGIIHAMEPAGFDPGLGLGGSGETPPDRARCVGFLAKPAARLVAAAGASTT